MAGEILQYVSRAAKNLRYRKELPFPHMRQRVSAVVWTHDPHLTKYHTKFRYCERATNIEKISHFLEIT